MLPSAFISVYTAPFSSPQKSNHEPRNGIASAETCTRDSACPPKITDAEKAKALKLIEEGKKIKEVAEQLQTSSKTVIHWRKASQQALTAKRKRAGQLKAAAESAHAAAETVHPPKAAPHSESPKLDALRGELAQLEKER